MKRLFSVPAVILTAALALSACGAPGEVSRNAPFNLTPVGEMQTQNWSLGELRVNVPRTLSVSEANSIKPRADIVWREDPLGDRYEQVQALMTEALEPALTEMTGSQPVIVQLDVTRFHAVTQRTRYTYGGQHEIEFTLTVVDAASGVPVSGPRHVDVTFAAYGGDRAVEAEAQGLTQRVRITQRLVQWVQSEFPVPAQATVTVASSDPLPALIAGVN